MSSTSSSNAPSKASNLKQHLQLKHKNIYKSVQQLDQEASQSQQSTSIPSTTTSKTSKQKLVDKYFTSDKVTNTMTNGGFRKYIIDLILKNGAALSLLESPAFRELSGEMAKQFNISLERHSISTLKWVLLLFTLQLMMFCQLTFNYSYFLRGKTILCSVN